MELLKPHLKVVFCGINPGLMTARLNQPFAHPTNRFWRILHQAGFTDRQLTPQEWPLLEQYGCGNTVLVQRATAAADELSTKELKTGGAIVHEKILRYQPHALAVLGKQAFCTAFNVSRAPWGKQNIKIGETEVWVLPHPSGLNRISIEKMIAEYKVLADILNA